jgi:murein DD-endopeptidase MepM/ murein hydrolase activator NlpD
MPDSRVVGFPLRGAGWMAVDSPADRVPSHGTDMLGQRYAIDLIKVDDRLHPRFHPASTLRTVVLGVPTRECYAWGEPVHSPLDGEVVAAVDGAGEPRRVHPVLSLFRVLWTGLTFRPGRLAQVLGNHIVMRNGDIFAAFVHLAPGTVQVSAGQSVWSGDLLGRVGHTRNSTSPHLHFQLMDAGDPLTASGVPFLFAEYEVSADGQWRRVVDKIPRRGERIRWTGT